MATLMDKHFNVRIKLRNDSWTNWEEKKDFIPYDGEVIIYDIPTQEEARTYGLGSLNYQLIKIGDGVKTLKQLPAINEMSTTLNIGMGSKKGTISVAGTDVYVNGLNNNNIMCFELKSSYATSAGLSSLRNQFNDRISSVQGDLRNQINTLENDLNNVESKLNNITGDSFSKIDILESELEQEKILRAEGDQLNQQNINNLQILMDSNDEEIESTVRNNHNTVTRLIEDETKARLDQIQSVEENISNIVNRLDILEESNEGGAAGKLLIQQIDNSYNFYQDGIEIGSIVIPEDNYIINGQVVKKDNSATIQLYTKEETPVLIDATNLIDTYYAEEQAEKIQLSISPNNVISASIVEKSITGIQIANSSITEENLSPDLVLKINSSNSGSSLPEEQLENLKQYIDESISMETGVISGDYGVNNVVALEYGSYFNIPSFTVNPQGKLTKANDNQLRLPYFSADTGGNNGTILINNKEVAVKGLGTAAYSDASDYELAGSVASSLANAKSYTDEAFINARAYTDNAKASLKNELLNGAGEAYDTLQELSVLINSNTTALQALNTVAMGKADKEHTHRYAGSSSTGGAAISANKINTDAGNLEQPVYFSNGVPVPITYTIKSNVPANAKFTDTTYSEATASSAGLMSAAMYSKLNGITAGASVTSVNSKTGAVSLTYTDIGAAASSHTHSEYSVTTHTHNYLPLSGGTITGRLTATSHIYLQTNGYPQIGFTNSNGAMNSLIYYGDGTGGVSSLVLRNYTDISDSSQFVQAYLSPDGGWHANSVWGAVYNDYAEFRSQNEEIEPGYVAYCDDDGKLKITTERLQKFEGVVSDTFGFSIGKTDENKTPLAVSGRVLVYGDPEEHFHSGDCVCAGPKGKVYRMTREEIIEFPDRIVGIVSEIPVYETWGTSNVKVNNRIWIKVR